MCKEVNRTRFLASVRLREMDPNKDKLLSQQNMNSCNVNGDWLLK